ncbi:2366_t:CDS:10 [Funneliformis geosporum]|uniref:2366_t:CDS:1 n=1 Tax=Funneliformis geosporum TaxID=1117311 RepID=A0A9W4WYQ4_9GLOM|nr:2366_t:CDS:10 [Funneliformis geosporum]
MHDAKNTFVEGGSVGGNKSIEYTGKSEETKKGVENFRMMKKRRREGSQEPDFYSSPERYKAPFLSIPKELLQCLKEGLANEIIIISSHRKGKLVSENQGKFDIFNRTFGKFPNCKISIYEVGIDKERGEGYERNTPHRSACKNLGSDKIFVLPDYKYSRQTQAPNIYHVKTTVSDVKDSDFAIAALELKNKQLEKDLKSIQQQRERENKNILNDWRRSDDISSIKKSLQETENFAEIETVKKKYLEKGGVISQLFQQVVDIYLEGKKIPLAGFHPLTKIIQKIYDIFVPLGYQVVESPEIESEECNFNKLNMPPHHPARAMQDTFYLNNNLLLRTHTTNIQSRILSENPNQELKIISAGKVYRRDDDDATHTHQFTQVDCFVVGKEISFAHLKGTLELLVKEIFGKKHFIRFRPSYFPFTEPSVEVDAACVRCQQRVEIAGAGLIHPQVLSNCGYDNQKFTGFAFAFGLERLLMIKEGVEDILGAVKEAISYESNALMIYLGAPQNARHRVALTELKIPEFKRVLVENKIDIDNVIVHGPYVLNMANAAREDIFSWSVEFLKKEIDRMEKIGLKTIVLHPGSAVDTPVNDSLSQLAKGINLVLRDNSTVRIALETMCGRGSEIGVSFEQLKHIMDKIEQKERIVIHVNDSSQELGAKIDRHENIGFGNIEANETPLEAAKREVFEETNLIIEDLEIVGEQAFDTKKPELPSDISADFALTLALPISYQTKQKPHQIAQEIIKATACPDLEYTITEQGYLNFRFPTSHFEHFFSETLVQEGQNLQAHFRHAFIGNTLANVYQFCGYQVVREYYINDRGGQINSLVNSVYYFYHQLQNITLLSSEKVTYAGQSSQEVAQKLITKWGRADHHGTIARLKSAYQLLDHKPESLQIILVQIVNLLIKEGHTKRFSKREGNTIELAEALQYMDIDQLKFFLLEKEPNQPLSINTELLKENKEKTRLYYIQYAYARCHQIFQKAQTKEKIVEENKPHHLVNYLYELARA